MHHVFLYTLLFACFLCPSFVWCKILELHVQESIDVYSRPDGRKKISQLGRGDRVVISSNIYKRFRKVLITYQGKKRNGFIAIKDIVRSTIRPRSDRLRNPIFYKNRKSIGIHPSFSFSQIGSQNLTIQDKEHKIESLKSFSGDFAIFGHFPLGLIKAIEISFSFSSSVFSGTIYLKNNVPNDTELETASGETEITIKQIGVGGVLKLYRHINSLFWYGPSLGLSLEESSKFTLNNEKIELNDKNFQQSQFFIVVGGAMGWDIQLINSIYLIPELRLEMSLLRKPFVLNGGIGVKAAWVF